MKYIYKSKDGHYYCDNGVSSNDINIAKTFKSNVHLFGYINEKYERISFEKELRKQKLLKIEKYECNVLS